MEDKALYTQILGIRVPWEITDIDLKMDQEQVDIYVEWPAGIEAPCPVCQKEHKERICKVYDRRKERVWRHLDTCQLKTFIHSHIPRIKCPIHGVKTISINWADEMARFTHLFEGLAIQMLKMSANRSQTAKVLRISWDELNRIMLRAVDRGLSRRKREIIPSIGIDEKSFLSGHSYVTIMTDHKRKRVIDVGENRDEDAVNTLWQGLSDEQRENVQSVCMDFWKAYISGARRYVPQADIVYDRFHVSKHLNEAVDKVRRKEHRELCRQKDTRLSKTKYLWLKNPGNWTEKDKGRYDILSESQLSVGRAWNRKELFREFWSLTTIEEAEIFFKRWYLSATHSRLKPIIEVAKMLKRHLEGLLAWIKHHVSNGLVESFNSKIQQIKSIARGFRDFNNYRIAILFHLGGLDMYPH
jgi:transposase